MSDEEAPNQITPRMLAVALIAEKIADLRGRLDAEEAIAPAGNLFHSRIVVLLHRTVEELQRAATYLETTADDVDDG